MSSFQLVENLSRATGVARYTEEALNRANDTIGRLEAEIVKLQSD